MPDCSDELPETQLRASANSAPALGVPELVLDRYEVLAELSRGGMGVVYRARDRLFDREVVLKTLRPDCVDAELQARFEVESRITAQLQHPNIPPIHDAGTLSDGRPFLAMKLIKGQTLADYLQHNTNATQASTFRIFRQVLNALAYAHAQGVVHRDLKPQNILLGSFGEVAVIDWGLAKATRTQPLNSVLSLSPERTTGSRSACGDFTQVGMVFGTPAYMPPEQANGCTHEVDSRSDVFSLGAILCEILTGLPPYHGKDAQSVLFLASVADLNPAFGRLTKCYAPQNLCELCARCLSPEREKRPRSAQEILFAFTEILDAETEAERRYQLGTAIRQANELARRDSPVRVLWFVVMVFTVTLITCWLIASIYSFIR